MIHSERESINGTDPATTPTVTASDLPSYQDVITDYGSFGEDEKRGSDSSSLTSFTIYETRTRYYIIGSNQDERKFRIIKIDRTIMPRRTTSEDPSGGLHIIDDGVVYTKSEMEDILHMIDVGNRSGKMGASGLKKHCTACGIIGFIRFLEGYYVLVITEKSPVALIGGQYVYHIDDTKLISITNPSIARIERKPDEARYVTSFQTINLNKNFYFSYGYDITHTLQYNMTRNTQCRLCRFPPSMVKPRPLEEEIGPEYFGFNDMFVWNHHLLRTGFKSLQADNPDLFPEIDPKGITASPVSDWVLPVIHGFVDQAKISVFGHPIYVTLIGRRSRHFAGARFHKRGANTKGHVANEVETEQIIHNCSVTLPPELQSNGDDEICALCGSQGILPGGYLCGHNSGTQVPTYTSFVQLRGSIPLYWSQDTSNMAPKPPIELTRRDPFFRAAAKHFDNVFERYGPPSIVLNLIKSKERHRRESLLGDEFHVAVRYLNQFLPKQWQIRYIAWDMARASKSHDQDVFTILENVADEVLTSTGFFQSGPEPFTSTQSRLNKKQFPSERVSGRRQLGIVRTNCIDCLDRTNAAQFVIGKCAFAHQLYALGVIPDLVVPFDCDAMNVLCEMYDDHGDTIALQYGGSHLVNTMETYRKTNAWTSHSRDMIESIKRYYSNSFTDAEKQDAINLLLGNFVPHEGSPMLWDLPTDFHLHNHGPEYKRVRRSYVQWWTPEHLALSAVHGLSKNNQIVVNRQRPQLGANVLQHYYQPKTITNFPMVFAFNMVSTIRVVPPREANVSSYNPFKVRASLTAMHDASAQNFRGSASRPTLKRMTTHDAIASGSSRESTTRAYWWLTDTTERNFKPSSGCASASGKPLIGSWPSKQSESVANQISKLLDAGVYSRFPQLEASSTLKFKLEATKRTPKMQRPDPFLKTEAEFDLASYKKNYLQTPTGEQIPIGYPTFEGFIRREEIEQRASHKAIWNPTSPVTWRPKESAPKRALRNLIENILNPAVSSIEAREYMRYIQQFGPSHISLIPSTPMFNLDPLLDPSRANPDYHFYQKSVRTGRSSPRIHHHEPLDVNPADEQVFASYVELGRRIAIMSSDHMLGSDSPQIPPASAAARRYDAYAGWLKTGKFLSNKTRPRLHTTAASEGEANMSSGSVLQG